MEINTFSHFYNERCRCLTKRLLITRVFERSEGVGHIYFFCNDLYDWILNEFEVCLSEHESRGKLIRVISLHFEVPHLFCGSIEWSRDNESVSEGASNFKGTGGGAFNGGGCLDVGAFVDGFLSEEGEVVGRGNINSGLDIDGGEGSLISDAHLNE